MAPKKAKKNKKIEFEDEGDDVELGDVPADKTRNSAKAAPAAKKKKAKKKPVAGEWSDEEDVNTNIVSLAPDDDEEDVAPVAKPKSKQAAATFALLQVPDTRSNVALKETCKLHQSRDRKLD
jgi:hypothetical protein